LNNPIVDTGEVHIEEPSNDQDIEKPQYHILVADDNMMNQIVTRDSLEKMGYSLDVAENGKECVEMYKQGNYDLILMDVQMPVMNGLQAAREIRSFDKNIPILAMTASVMEHDKIKCYKSGMNATVPKPIKPKNLHTIISKYLSPDKTNKSLVMSR
jgi:CheY-like chemotaxis protein